MGSRVKKYRMKAIPSAFSEKGGFNAQFVGDGYSIDARTEILPDVIRANGIQVGDGAAWDLVTAFLKTCAQRVANTGETVNVGSLMSFGLSIKGWYEHKDSKAEKDSVRVSATLLGDLKPTVAFSMSNALEGATIMLYTVMSAGCGLGHVRQGAAFRINGKELKMLEGDTVTAELKAEGGTKVSAVCPVIESDDDHIDATLPAEFSDAAYVGREVTFTVNGRCGDPDAGTQSKQIAATLDAAGDEPGPTPAVITLRTAVTEGMMDNNIRLGSEPITLEGENLTLGEGDKLYAKNADNSDDDYVEIPSRFVSRNTATAIDLSEDSGDSLWAWLGEEVGFSEEHGSITFKLVSHGGVPSSEPQTVTTTAVVQFA